MKNKLAMCPCGQHPEELHLENSFAEKWSRVSGDCCNEWTIEFRSQYKIDDEKMRLAVEAWNESPRGWTREVLE